MMTYYPELDETVSRCRLPNGMTVITVPRRGFAGFTAYLTVNYGSVHTDFLLDGKPVHVPEGTAHYLEHKMFELPGGRDVSAEFAALGAGVNAFTSYDMTSYYFSCTHSFDTCLRLLLEFVTTPCFPVESVLRERGIIDQEIGMNLDAPDSVVFDKLMEAMYTVHPVRFPILGTSRTIRAITPEVLTACHQAFYTPANMVLCIVGDVDPEAVIEAARQMTGDAFRAPAEKLRHWDEPMTVPVPRVEARMEVAMPTFNLCFKCEPVPDGQEGLRQELIGDLACEALLGESSELYLRLYEKGLIDSSFGGSFDTLDGCAMLTCSGDSDDPYAVQEAILAEAEQLLARGIPDADFLRLKRSGMGRRIRSMDSFDGTCFRLSACALTDADYFGFPEVFRSLQKEELLAFLARTVRRERCGICVIRPPEEAE